ncbi:MAG: hypothetical protein KAS04_00580 [Candidatus Aenigmarchaeota archaeon]|nr:hypothetical protein [Candidatus Aenigmarchaeota archaeon]
MTEVSNNMLAGLLSIVIVMSLFSVATVTFKPLGESITGAATGTGLVNLTLDSAVEIVLLRNDSEFGEGYPSTTGNGILNIASNESDNCGVGRAAAECFNNGSQGNGTDLGTGTLVYPFVARVDGNDVTTCLRVQAGSSAVAFIGGADQTPTFRFAGKNNESVAETGADADSCYGTLADTWTAVTTSYTTICDTVNHTDENDEVRIHWELGIPTDAEGEKSNTMTICAAGDCGSC